MWRAVFLYCGDREVSSDAISEAFAFWSPDGQEIAYTEAGDDPDPSGLSGDIHVVDVETGEVRPLTQGDDPVCCPSWKSVAAP